MAPAADTLGRSVTAATVTVGGLRDLLTDLAPDVEVHVGVFDSNRFNVLVGTLPVTSPQVTALPGGSLLLLRVPGIS